MPPKTLKNAAWKPLVLPSGWFPEARHSTPAVEISAGKYFVLGGINNTRTCSDSFIMNTLSGEVTNIHLRDVCVFEHAATTMKDGRVICCGGRKASKICSHVHIVNLNQGNVAITCYSSLKSAPKGRTCHSLTTLPNGSCLLYGGYGGHSNYFNDVHLLDPTPSWAKLKMSGEPGKKRAGHSAVFLTSGPHAGSILIFGGYNRDSYFNDVDLIQQQQGKWHWVQGPVEGPVPYPRGCHSVQLTADGNMLVWGGAGPQSTLLNDLAVLNTWAMTWSTPKIQGDLPSKRYAHCSMLTSTGLIIFGGTGEQDRFDELSMLEFDVADINACTKCAMPSLNAVTCPACKSKSKRSRSKNQNTTQAAPAEQATVPSENPAPPEQPECSEQSGQPVEPAQHIVPDVEPPIVEVNPDLMKLAKKVGEFFRTDPADVPVLCNHFEALVQDRDLLVPEVQTLMAEKAMLQDTLKTSKSKLVQKQIDLEAMRKANLELQGLEIESASADRLAELQKIYATASQTVALRQEELRNRELQELQVEKELLEDRSLCCICMSEPINAVIMPCAHLCACVNCLESEEVNLCPICRTNVVQVIRTYMP